MNFAEKIVHGVKILPVLANDVLESISYMSASTSPATNLGEHRFIGGDRSTDLLCGLLCDLMDRKAPWRPPPSCYPARLHPASLLLLLLPPYTVD